MNATEETARIIEEEGVVVEGGAFYNPAQKFNRTLTIKIINQFIRNSKKDGIRLLECMSATGLRGIRYIKELHGENTIVMNDISLSACSSIVENCLKNGINAKIDEVVREGESSAVEIRNEDCRVLMLKRKREFDVIDIDPFGTCAPYIETALEALADNGLLCVTSTDTKVLCDKPPESCYKYYGAVSLNNPHSHETAIRIILSYISRIAAKSGKSVEPLVSLSMDFFIRVFVQVTHNKKKSTETLFLNKQYLMCTCMNREDVQILQKEQDKHVYRHVKAPVSTRCRLCKRVLSLYGPFWSGPLHNKKFLKEVIEGIDKTDILSKTGGDKKTAYTSSQINRRIHGMLAMACDELESCFYYSIPAISSILSFPAPPLTQIISFLQNNGISVSLTHCKPNSIKTNGEIEYVYLAVVLYYETIKKETYIIYRERLLETRKDIEKNTHNLMVCLEEYRKQNTVVVDFTATALACDITARKYLKFQDKSGLGWGPVKK